MPPNASSVNSSLQNKCEENQAHLECPKELQAKIIAETKALNKQYGISEKIKKKKGLFEFETELIWTNIIAITTLHILGVYYALTFPYIMHWKTLIWGK